MNSTSGPSNLIRQHQQSSRLVQSSTLSDNDLFDDIPCGTYRLNFGSNFFTNKSAKSEYHTVKFDKKPSSVNGDAFLSFNDKDAIKITIPSESGESDNHSIYKGTIGSNKNGKECILLLDGENLRIERLSTVSNVKHIRSEGSDDMVDIELLKRQAESNDKPWIPPKIKDDISYKNSKQAYWSNRQKSSSTSINMIKPQRLDTGRDKQNSQSNFERKVEKDRKRDESKIIKNEIKTKERIKVEKLIENNTESDDDEQLLLDAITKSSNSKKRELQEENKKEDVNMDYVPSSAKRKLEENVPKQTILAVDLDLSSSSDDDSTDLSDSSNEDDEMDYSSASTLKKVEQSFDTIDDKCNGPMSAASTTSTFSRPMSSASRFSNGTNSCGPSPLLRTPGGSSGPSPSLTRTPGSSGPSPLLRTPGSTSSGPSPILRPPSTSFSSHSSTSGCSSMNSYTSTLTPASSILTTDLQLSESSSEDDGD